MWRQRPPHQPTWDYETCKADCQIIQQDAGKDVQEQIAVQWIGQTSCQPQLSLVARSLPDFWKIIFLFWNEHFQGIILGKNAYRKLHLWLIIIKLVNFKWKWSVIRPLEGNQLATFRRSVGHFQELSPRWASRYWPCSNMTCLLLVYPLGMGKTRKNNYCIVQYY